MALISVIIPVYNTKPYLNACLESVVGQTYRELEIILVDDGSTDGSGELCDEWARKDARIRVVHKENGGLSSARNAGMSVGKGAYFGFVDSDDIISPKMFEVLSRLADEHSADIVQCGYVCFSSFSPQIFSYSAVPVVHSYHTYDAVKSMITDAGVDVICCNKLIRREIAKQVLFEEGRINEDVLWTFRVVAGSSKTVVTSEPFYGYYQREGSIMNSRYTEKRFDGIYALEQRAKEVKAIFPDLFPLAERQFAGGCMYHYQLICRLPDSDEYRDYRKRLYDLFIHSDLKSVFSVTGLKYRVWYTLFRMFPAMTCRIRNLLRIGL